MNRTRGIFAGIAICATALPLIVGGCSSNARVYGSVSYNYGYGYYDPWYRNDVIVVNPPARPRPPFTDHRRARRHCPHAHYPDPHHGGG